jgi:hypothetical protein
VSSIPASQAERIAALCANIGDAEGLERVRLEMDSLCARLEAAKPVFARGELRRLDASIASLSSAIFEMDRIVREKIRELGGENGYGG